MGQVCLFRRVLVLGIVTLFFGASWMAVLSGNVSVMAAGATIYVDDDNTDAPWDGSLANPYQNITSGLAHASDGDTVYVFGGMYSENVVVNKSIALKGDSKPVINGLGGRGINITVYDNFVYGVTVDGFDIRNCSNGIYLGMQYIANNVTDLSVIIGDVILSNNTISSSSDGIFVDVHDVGVYMYGNSSVVIGDFRVTNNIISSSGMGIDVNGFYNIGIGMSNSTAFSMGSIEITGNTVNSTLQGIYLYKIRALGAGINDDSSFMMGSILVNDNTVNSRNRGIAPWFIQHFGYFLFGDSSFSMKNIEFCRNRVNSTIDAIGFSQFTDFGTQMSGNSSFSMGNVLVNDNDLHSIIWLTGFGNFGAYLYENSSCTMGSVEFCRNIISTDWAAGLTFYGLRPFGYEMYNYSVFKMGDFSVNNNVVAINGTYSGISLLGSQGFGINVYDNAVATSGSFEFEGNDISYGWVGLSLYSLKSAAVRDNVIRSCKYGIYMQDSADNVINRNSFYGNGYGIYLQSSSNNVILGNNITSSNNDGILLYSSCSNNTISGNNIADSAGKGVLLHSSSNCTISGNSIANCDYGVTLEESSTQTTIFDNKITKSHTSGIFVNASSNNILSRNNIRDSSNEHIYLRDSHNNIVSENTLTNSTGDVGIYVWHCWLSSFVGNNVTSNANTGIHIDWAWDSIVSGNYVSENLRGVYLWSSGNIAVSGNEITANHGNGVVIDISVNIDVSGNNITSNWYDGVYVTGSSGNRIYHNNFSGNTVNAYVEPNCNNTWDSGYPSGGNYWSDYSGNDHYEGPSQNIPGNDAIGDTPYEVNVNNTDRYPLIAPYEPLRPLFLESEGRWNMGEVEFEVRSVFAADVDADGAVEIMTCAQVNQSGELRIYDYDGLTITLERVEVWSSTDGDTRAWSVYAADVEGDGVTEILTGAETYNGQNNVYYDGQLRIWTWNGTTLTLEHSEEWHTGNNTHVYSVFAYDVNDDGKVEIITGGDAYDAGNRYICEFRVWSWNGTDLTLEASEEWGTGGGEAVWSVRALDVDGDGVVELLTAGEDDSQAQLRIWTWNGTILTMEHSEEWTLGGWMDRVISVFASDIDNDGVVEVVTGGDAYDGSYVDNGQLRVWNWNGSSLALESNIDWPLNGTYAYAWTVCPGDVDRDGLAEIITAGAFGSGAQLRVWSFDGLTLKLDASQESIYEWADTVFAGDADGDGTIEIITAGYTYDAMYGYEQVKIWSFPESIPPTITIMSPENKAYSTSTIPLTFTVNEPAKWIAYSLNGQANVTITGNTNLPTLPDGWHHVTIYANDTFDNMGFATVYFTVDTAKPSITNVVQDPLNNIQPDTVVKISATVADATSGIKQVLLNCTFNNSTDTWYAELSMTHLTGDIWNTNIRPQTYGTNATYVIIAEDNAGNTITTEQIYGYRYEYLVVSEFPLPAVFLIFAMATLLMAVALKKKRKCTQPQSNFLFFSDTSNQTDRRRSQRISREKD